MTEKPISRPFDRWLREIYARLWAPLPDGASKWQRAGKRALQVCQITLERFTTDLCPVRAAALTFTSLMG
jgi:hypothetical protein